MSFGSPGKEFDGRKGVIISSIADVLSYVEYQPQALFESLRATAEAAVRKGTIDISDRQRLLEEYAASLRGYTYFERG